MYRKRCPLPREIWNPKSMTRNAASNQWPHHFRPRMNSTDWFPVEADNFLNASFQVSDSDISKFQDFQRSRCMSMNFLVNEHN